MYCHQCLCSACSRVKTSSQYDAGASIVLRASGWCWSWLKLNSSITSPALVSTQPIRLSKMLTSGLNLTSEKDAFTHDAPPASYRGPALRPKLWTPVNQAVWCWKPVIKKISATQGRYMYMTMIICHWCEKFMFKHREVESKLQTLADFLWS